MRPIELVGEQQLVNHTAPSGPGVIPNGAQIPGSVKFDTTPAPEAPLAALNETGSTPAARPPTTSATAHRRRPPSTVSLRLIPAPSHARAVTSIVVRLSGRAGSSVRLRQHLR